METTLLLWASSSSSSREIAMNDSVPLSPNPNPKPKTERRGKAPNPNPKTKIPQRGLGVAQLERIRLQEHDAIGAYSYPLARVGVPVAYAGTTAPALIGYGSASAIRSALHEQYSMDRVRTGANPYLQELPSNQRGMGMGMGMAACLSEHCDFCVNKKKSFGENLGFHESDGFFSIMDAEERRGKFVREIREYEFFPNNSSSTMGDPTAGVSAPAASGDGSFLDLSLKL